MDSETNIYLIDQDQESFLTIFFGFFQKIMALSWYKNDKKYNIYLFALWMIFASIFYFISFGINSSRAVFVWYCCNIWIVVLAFLFLLIV